MVPSRLKYVKTGHPLRADSCDIASRTSVPAAAIDRPENIPQRDTGQGETGVLSSTAQERGHMPRPLLGTHCRDIPLRSHATATETLSQALAAGWAW